MRRRRSLPRNRTLVPHQPHLELRKVQEQVEVLEGTGRRLDRPRAATIRCLNPRGTAVRLLSPPDVHSSKRQRGDILLEIGAESQQPWARSSFESNVHIP